MKLIFLAFGLVLALIGGCASSGATGNGPKFSISDISTGTEPGRAAVAQVGGQLAVVYSNKDGRVVYQDGTQRQFLDETARVKNGATYFQLHASENNVQVFWWSHQDGKNIYSTTSRDGGKVFTPVVAANDDHGVLPPFHWVSGANGVVGLAYHDERVPGYQIYTNRSVDWGATWPGPDVRQDIVPSEGRSSQAFEPVMVKAGENWVLAWTDSIPNPSGGKKYRILVRISDDQGQNWSDPSELASSDHHISSLNMRAEGRSVVVVADELQAGVFACVSVDGGKSWRRVEQAIEGSSGATNSGIRLSLTPSGDMAFVVWTEERGMSRPTIQASMLRLENAKWLSPSRRLDTKNVSNTRSTDPRLLVTKKGTVIVSWLDYRDIRPNIYFVASYDKGASWTQPLPLMAPGLESVGRPQLVSWNDGALIAYERYAEDKIMEGTFEVVELQLGESESQLKKAYGRSIQYSELQRRERLEQRVRALWSARVSGDFAAAYDIFDFAYKAATPKKAYLDNVGVITYHDYEVGNIAVQENVADVAMTIRYEVKPTILPTTGKPITIQPFTTEVPTQWVWVGDDWYLVYKPSFDQPVLSY